MVNLRLHATRSPANRHLRRRLATIAALALSFLFVAANAAPADEPGQQAEEEIHTAAEVQVEVEAPEAETQVDEPAPAEVAPLEEAPAEEEAQAQARLEPEPPAEPAATADADADADQATEGERVGPRSRREVEYDVLRALEQAAEFPAEESGMPMRIGGITVRPGTRSEFRLQTTEDFTAGNVEAWGVVVNGSRPGPVLCLIGGIHGDELNGVEIVRRVIESEPANALSGTLVGVPIVNVSGFINQTRYLPDRRDLNRYFPGRANGSIASRVAWELWTKVIVHCTHLIDLHTGSHNRTNLPQIRGDLNNPIVLDMARAFDARVAVHNLGLNGTLRGAAARAGIAAVLYEAGETLWFQEAEIAFGVAGVRNVMRSLGMRRIRPVNLGPQEIFHETRWLRADRGGILDLRVKPGDMVAVGDVVGVTSDPLRQTRSDLVSRRRGRVIGIALLPMVSPGMAVVHLGIPGSRFATAELDDELDNERPE